MPKASVSFVFFDSNIERIPTSYSEIPQIRRLATRYGKKAAKMLLDRAIHHPILKSMIDADRRGRPDIVHLSVLSLTDTPLYQSGLVNFALHTVRNMVIVPNGIWRPPRNYNNFLSLFEQLLENKKVPPSGEPILTAAKGELVDALNLFRPEKVVLFSSRGRLVDLRRFFEISDHEGCVYLIGAYARGPPRKAVLELADDVISIYPKMLAGWVVASRAIYELERSMKLDLLD
jgi:rRNA small subunit pseudouridine methyltransferase Nep1